MDFFSKNQSFHLGIFIWISLLTLMVFFIIIIGGLTVVAGAGFLLGNVDAVEILGFIGWIGMLLVALGLGVQTLRSKG